MSLLWQIWLFGKTRTNLPSWELFLLGLLLWLLSLALTFSLDLHTTPNKCWLTTIISKLIAVFCFLMSKWLIGLQLTKRIQVIYIAIAIKIIFHWTLTLPWEQSAQFGFKIIYYMRASLSWFHLEYWSTI